MGRSRIEAAVAGFAALPDDGAIGVYGPGADTDLSSLPRDRLRLFQPLRPLHDLWKARGFAAAPEPEGRLAAALVIAPRSRAQLRGWISDAAGRMPAGAPVWVDGLRTDGIESALRDLEAICGRGEMIAMSHGRIAAFRTPGPIAQWTAACSVVAGGFVTLPGVFSADGPDPGSQALAAALPERIGPRVVDLGAGWGWLSGRILEREAVASLTLVEADHVALCCARRNIADPRATFLWADATGSLPGLQADTVVMNPPFHAGRTGDPSLGAAFITTAARLLSPSGVLWMVANRHLPYEATLAAHFRDVAELPGTASFKILNARRPRR